MALKTLSWEQEKETFLVFPAFCSSAENVLQPVSAVLFYCNWWPHDENESSAPFTIAYLFLSGHSGGNHETFRRSVVSRYLQSYIFLTPHAYNPGCLAEKKKKKKQIHKDKLAKTHREQNRRHTFRKLKIFGRTSHSISHLEELCQVACSYLYGSAEARWFYWWLVAVLQVDAWQFGQGDFLVVGTSSDLEHIYCSCGVGGKKFHPPCKESLQHFCL